MYKETARCPKANFCEINLSVLKCPRTLAMEKKNKRELKQKT